MTASQTTHPTVTAITISTYGENVVADSEYRESDPTYPKSMWDAATERVIESLRALYPDATIDTNPSQGFAFRPGLEVEVSEGDADDATIEAVGYHVESAWQTALESPEVIAIGAPKQ